MAEARLNREYALRLCGVGAIMLALSVWSVYDGAVAWPRVNGDMDKARPDLIGLCESGKTPEDLLASADGEAGTFLLQTVFAAHGAKVPRHVVQELAMITTPPGDAAEARKMRSERAVEFLREPIYSSAKIKGQFVQAGVTLVFAMLSFYAVIGKRKTVYIADGSGLSGSGFGASPVAWSEVAGVNWDKWDEKGIIVLTLHDGRTFKLDGWHFAGMRPIADVIRDHVK